MTKIFAHRGFSGKYPENTMLAFEKAIEAGADGIELDVQFTKDREIVIIHDETIDRTTNGSGEVVSYTYDELKEFDASYIYEGKMGFNRIPTLREYFDLVKDKNIITNIELKTGINEYLGIEKKVYDLIEEYDLKDKVIISSFNHYSVMRMKEVGKDLEYGLLSETWIIDAGKYVENLGVECYHPHFKNLTEEVVQEIKSHGIKINTFTVNKEEDMMDMYKKKIDIIISNFPDLARIVLEKYIIDGGK